MKNVPIEMKMKCIYLGPAQFDSLSSPNPLPFVLLLGMEMGWGRQGARSAAHRGVSSGLVPVLVSEHVVDGERARGISGQRSKYRAPLKGFGQVW